VALNAGTTSSAVVVGSAGEKLQLVPVADASTAGAPKTGFGGLGDDVQGPQWSVVLLGSLAAGVLGMLAHRSLSVRRARAGR